MMAYRNPGIIFMFIFAFVGGDDSDEAHYPSTVNHSVTGPLAPQAQPGLLEASRRLFSGVKSDFK